MNAVATKGRKLAASTSKIKTPPLSPLEIVRSDLRSAYYQLEMARDATDIGDPAHALLNLSDEMMRSQIAAIGHESLTRLMVGRVYEAMFATLAMLQGVMALTRGTVAFHPVQQAHALLDNAHTALDVGPLLSALPPGNEETDFLRGRDLAVDLLKEGERMGWAAAVYRNARANGNAQSEYVRPILQKVFADESLLPGFCAVLSAALAAESEVVIERMYRAPISEWRAGPAGADGTEATYESEQAQTLPAQSTEHNNALIEKPLRHWHQATAATEMTTEAVGGNDLFWAALALMRHAAGELTAARSKDAAELASLTMCQAIAVLHACNTAGLDAGGHGLDASITLAELAKEEFDVVIEGISVEVQHA